MLFLKAPSRFPCYKHEINLKLLENLARIQVEQKTELSTKICVVQFLNTEVSNYSYKHYKINEKGEKAYREGGHRTSPLKMEILLANSFLR